MFLGVPCIKCVRYGLFVGVFATRDVVGESKKYVVLVFFVGVAKLIFFFIRY